VFNLDPELGANVTETVPGTDNVAVTTTGADLVSFLQQRADDNGLVTFMVAIDAENRGYGFASRENEDVTLRPSLEVTAVPEPASLALIGLGGLAMLKRRR